MTGGAAWWCSSKMNIQRTIPSLTGNNNHVTIYSCHILPLLLHKGGEGSQMFTQVDIDNFSSDEDEPTDLYQLDVPPSGDSLFSDSEKQKSAQHGTSKVKRKVSDLRSEIKKSQRRSAGYSMSTGYRHMQADESLDAVSIGMDSPVDQATFTSRLKQKECQKIESVLDKIEKQLPSVSNECYCLTKNYLRYLCQPFIY